MKFKVLTTQGKKYTKEIFDEVSAEISDYDLVVDFDIEETQIDFSHPNLYQINWYRSFQEIKKATSLKNAIMKMFVDTNYQGTIFFIGDDVAPQTHNLRGMHTHVENYYGLMQVYSEPSHFVRKQTYKNKTSYINTTRKTDMKRDVYVAIHEILHNIEARVGKEGKDLHKAVELDLLEEYTSDIIGLLKKKDNFPLKDWETTISQHYKNIDWKLYPQTGIHWGVDHAVPTGTPIYATHDGFLREDDIKVKALGTTLPYSFWNNGKFYTLVFAHLSKKNRVGEYKKGDIIGYTGNTGFSTGEHLHTELWRGLIVNDRSKEKLEKLTLDPIKFYKK
jgi:hypothetical protein